MMVLGDFIYLLLFVLHWRWKRLRRYPCLYLREKKTGSDKNFSFLTNNAHSLWGEDSLSAVLFLRSDFSFGSSYNKWPNRPLSYLLSCRRFKQYIISLWCPRHIHRTKLSSPATLLTWRDDTYVCRVIEKSCFRRISGIMTLDYNNKHCFKLFVDRCFLALDIKQMGF